MNPTQSPKVTDDSANVNNDITVSETMQALTLMKNRLSMVENNLGMF